MPAPRALRLLRPLLRPHQTVIGLRGESSCTGGSPPACPPCAPAPRPACRARPASALPARRVVCCPPPPGARPPCAAPAPPGPLTCHHRQTDAKKTSFVKSDECGEQMDRVTQRLHAQDMERRAQYEREVEARRNAPPPAPPAAACGLPAPAARELATDGKTYVVLGAPPPPAPRCPAPGAPPPPAQPVTLRPAGACGARRAGLDPCAHRPRVLVSIDRSSGPSASTDPKSCAFSDPNPKKLQSEGKNTKGFGSRIMQTLGRRTGGVESGSKQGIAKRAGDSSWCRSMQKPASAPPQCREQSVAERLRREPPAPSGKRGLHTTPRAAITERPRPLPSGREAAVADAKKLEAVLKEREGLKAAGQGRTVVPAGCRAAPPPPATGALEMQVPAGADTLCVHVSVGKTPCDPSKGASSKTKCPRGPCGATQAPGGSEGWLSIERLQKKLSGRGRGEPAPGPGAGDEPRPAGPGLCAPRRPLKTTDIALDTIPFH